MLQKLLLVAFGLAGYSAGQPSLTRASESLRLGNHGQSIHPYVVQLYKNLTYEGGSLSHLEMMYRPITIWSFLDVDLVKKVKYPMRVNSSKGTQTLINVFNFNHLKKEKNDCKGNLNKAMLRLYKDSNSTNQCSTATIQYNISFCKLNGGQEMEFISQKVHIDMSNDQDSIDIDLTQNFKRLWPIPDVVFELYVTVTLKSECKDGNLAIKLLDWKSNKTLKIQRKSYTQHPVLCIYIGNQVIKNKALKSKPKDETLKLPTDDHHKRHAIRKRDMCRKVHHTVSFIELGMDYVIAPPHFNAGKCVGRCDRYQLHHLTFTGQSEKTNNYARLLANQATKRNEELTICCNPGLYEPVMLLIQSADGTSIKLKMYTDMKVKDCYCR